MIATGELSSRRQEGTVAQAGSPVAREDKHDGAKCMDGAVTKRKIEMPILLTKRPISACSARQASRMKMFQKEQLLRRPELMMSPWREQKEFHLKKGTILI